MASGIVVLAGSLPVEHLSFDRLVSNFGWSLKNIDTLDGLEPLSGDHSLVSVLFSPASLGLPWEEALRSVLDRAPKALPILCHGFAEMPEWSQVADAGAFHSLLLPLKEHEVRQSLGFVWRAHGCSATISLRNLKRAAQSEHPGQARARAGGTVG